MGGLHHHFCFMVVLMPTKTYPILDFCFHGRILKVCYDELFLHVTMVMISRWDLDNDIKPQFKLIIPTKGTHINEVYFFILLSLKELHTKKKYSMKGGLSNLGKLWVTIHKQNCYGLIVDNGIDVHF